MRALRTGDRIGYSHPVARLAHTLLGEEEKVALFARLAEFPWSRVDLAGFPTPIYVCFGEISERAVIAGLMLSPGLNREITARALREIPLSRLLLLPKHGLIAGRLKRS